MQSRLVGTVVFPSRHVVAGGVLLVLTGLGLLGVILTRPVIETPGPLAQIGSGDLRPPLALLPADSRGTRIAIAVREISQGEYFRVTGAVPAAIASTNGTPTGCPARLAADMPVTCITPYEAATYANALTRLTNEHAGMMEPLTECYRLAGNEVRWTDRACTGFRLPTEAEWRVSARAGQTQDYAGTYESGQRCLYARIAGCRGVNGPGPVARRQPNAWYLFDMSGNVAEIAYAPESAEGRPGVAAADRSWILIGGAWNNTDSLKSPVRALSGRDPTGGFRIVRTLPNADAP